jgi:phosphatidylglycerophosphate synthase
MALSGGLFAALVLSDALDGRVARRLGAATRWGGRLDVIADIFSVFLLLSGLAAMGECPWWTPLPPVATTVGFVAIPVGERLGFDPIGKHFGAVLFVAIGIVLFANSVAVGLGTSVAIALLSAVVLGSRWKHGLRT